MDTALYTDLPVHMQTLYTIENCLFVGGKVRVRGYMDNYILQMFPLSLLYSTKSTLVTCVLLIQLDV